MDVQDGDILLGSFYHSDIGAMQLSFLGKLFLREPLLESLLANFFAKGD
jgi:hypothetical protein